ncbi:response regulator [Roseomonas marmotae]|uniref:Response regulator transcription factor n=1 Tax=Roseomonas marmotae TaxID=2768161 RepID=A0ABS3KL51_9PROT|nr:response regulator [Roseomonas marmotae]MBO1077061.1 response regulator transcription factor [Roseomonas marmotae]QTI81884.1 response regulator transcription factor [Roseomonas marmotae]
MTTILVVDDEFLIADVLSFALEDEGFMAVRASNGRKGLDVFQRDRPALVITDFMMPVMNGLEFAQAIQERTDGDPPPIILMSGAQADIARQNAHLFAAVFDKPFRVSEIVDAVIALVGRPGG